MLSDGQYSAWFRAPHADGMGVITLANGRMSGNDTVIAYSGSYQQSGDSFTATISTRRHADGPPGIFGIDDLDIEVSGTSETNTASCVGTIRQAPEMPFQVVLVRIDD